MFKDAIDTAAESGKGEVVEELLQYFCKFSEKEVSVVVGPFGGDMMGLAR